MPREKVTIDGNDVLLVYRTAMEAVERAKKGLGPTLIECVTCRWEGHYSGDPVETYRTKDEIVECKSRCPIKRFKAKLLESKALTQKEIDDMELAAKTEIEVAVEFGERSPWPNPEDALKDTFVAPYY